MNTNVTTFCKSFVPYPRSTFLKSVLVRCSVYQSIKYTTNDIKGLYKLSGFTHVFWGVIRVQLTAFTVFEVKKLLPVITSPLQENLIIIYVLDLP